MAAAELSLRTSPQAQGDPVKDVLFSFYNGELFRMVVNYDPGKTQGLTNDDMVGAISATYGTPSRPAARTISFSSAQGYSETEKIYGALGRRTVFVQLLPLLLPA